MYTLCVFQFFASMVSTFTLNVVQSYAHEVPWKLSYAGLVNFGKFEVSWYTQLESVDTLGYSLRVEWSHLWFDDPNENLATNVFFGEHVGVNVKSLSNFLNVVMFQNISYTGMELPLYVVMAVIGT